MNKDPDSPRTIKQDIFEEQVWEDLWLELDREPTEDEFDRELEARSRALSR